MIQAGACANVQKVQYCKDKYYNRISISQWPAYLGNNRVTCHGSLVIPIKISLVSTFLSWYL